MAEYKSTLQSLTELNKARKKSSPKGEAPVTIRDIIKPPPAPEAEPIKREEVASVKPKRSRKEKTAATSVTKETVKLKKNITLLVKKFAIMESMISSIKQILSSDLKPPAKVASIESTITAGGDAYKLAEAAMEEKATVGGAIKGVTDSVAKAVPGIAALVLALPLLFSPEVRNIILSFFTGFLEGLGVSSETLENLGTYVKIALGALTAVFTYKALSPILTVFEKMKELAKVLGFAGEAVNDQKTQVDADKEKIDKEKKQVKDAQTKAKGEIKDSKSELRKNRKMGILKKPGFLLKKIGPKLLNLVKNFVKALPIVGTVLGIGMVLYDLFDIGRDIYNFFTGEDSAESEPQQEQEEAQEQVLEDAPAPAATAVQAPTEAPAKKEEAPPPATTATPVAPPVEPAQAQGSSPAAPVEAAPVASAVQKLSEEVSAQEVEIKMTGGSNITIIDNTSTVVGVSEDSTPLPGASFSVSVGK